MHALGQLQIISTHRVQTLDVLWVGETGYEVALVIILVIVALLSKSIHFKRLKHPLSTVTMTGVLVKEIIWLHDELISQQQLPPLGQGGFRRGK